MVVEKFDILRYYQRAKQHAATTLQFTSLVSVGQYIQVFKTSLRYLRVGSTALDWGSGNGHFSYFLLDRGVDVTTYGFQADSPEMLGGRNRHVDADITEPVKLSFEDGVFDYVFSIGVLEHVHETGGDQAASMTEICRVLKPGGIFLCFHFPNRYGWVERFKKKLMPTAHVHSRKFVQRDIADLCQAAHMELIEVGRYNFLPRNEASRLMGKIADLPSAAMLFNWLDWALCKLMPRFATNFYFVARTSSVPERA